MKDNSIERGGRFAERTNWSIRTRSIICALAGVGALVAAFVTCEGSMWTASLVGLVGLCMAVYGVLKAAFGSTQLTDTESGLPIKRLSLYFTPGARERLMQALRDGAWGVVSDGKRDSCTGPLMLKMWYTADGSFAAVELQEYVPYEYVTIVGMKEVSDSDLKRYILP